MASVKRRWAASESWGSAGRRRTRPPGDPGDRQQGGDDGDQPPRHRRHVVASSSSNRCTLPCYGRPTHSSEPSSKIWCFQIGTLCLEVVDETPRGGEGLLRDEPQQRPRPPQDHRSRAGQCGGGPPGARRGRPWSRASTTAASSAKRRGVRGVLESAGRPSRLPKGPSWSRTAPTKTTTPPAPASETADSTASTESGESMIASSGCMGRIYRRGAVRYAGSDPGTTPGAPGGYGDMVNDLPFGFGLPDPEDADGLPGRPRTRSPPCSAERARPTSAPRCSASVSCSRRRRVRSTGSWLTTRLGSSWRPTVTRR